MQTFPKTDRGLFGEEGSDNEDGGAAGPKGVVEEDFIEAATKKAKLKQQAMREKRKQRDAEASDEDGEMAKKRVRFVNDEEEVLGSEDEYEHGTDSDEIIYDSEEEDEAQRQFEERKKKKMDSKKERKRVMDDADDGKPSENFYDIEAEVKKNHMKFKPAEGVKFKQFDALGLPTDDGIDYYKYITTDTNTLDTVIDASPE